MSSLIDLPVIDKDVLIFELDDVKKLRSLGILGVLIGSLPVAPQQNNFLGLPLKLTIYEVIWLVLNHHARLIDNKRYSLDCKETFNNRKENFVITPYTRPNSTKENPPHDYVIPLSEFINGIPLDKQKLWIFCKIKQQGYYILPGLKFGGDFVAYPGDPLRYHSHLIINHVSKVKLMDLVVGGRLASGVKKLWVISDIEDTRENQDNDSLIEPTDKERHTFSIEWAGFG